MHEFIYDEPWCFGSCYYRCLNHPPMKWENSPDDYGDYCTVEELGDKLKFPLF